MVDQPANRQDHLAPTNDPLPWSLRLTVLYAVVGPIAAWALHLNLTYFLVQPVCRMGGDIALHLSGVLALLILSGAIVTSALFVARNPVPFRENVEGFDGWVPFIGLFGISLGLLCGVAIIAQWSTVFTVGPCLVSP